MTLSITNTFSTGTSIVAAQMNANFDDIEAYVNGTGGNAGLMPKDGGTFSGALVVNGDVTVDTSTFKIDSTNNVVGIGTAAPSASYKLDVTGDARVSGTLTAGAFSGTATEATNVTAVANNSANETVYLTFVDGVSGTQGIETDSGLTYNPSTGVLTTTQVTGNLTGNVTGNLTGNVTGNVSGSSGSCTGNAVTATTAATVTTNAQPAITSVGTLTGLTVSGTLTLDSIGISNVDSGSSFTDNDSSIMTSGAIKDKIESYGYKKVTIQASAPSGVEGDLWIDT